MYERFTKQNMLKKNYLRLFKLICTFALISIIFQEQVIAKAIDPH